ncbi:exported hypothetical protein [Candidatus Sulfopaludibacter sp. SbA4]|nr:exported hypothetical protein [Candidatus Sulfopaludibacter sp. SbA4]
MTRYKLVPLFPLILAVIFSAPGQAQFTQQGAKLVGTGAVGAAGSPVFQGQSVALSSDGNTAIVGGNNDNPLTPAGSGWAGAAWIYTRSGGTWTQQGPKLVGTGAQGGAQQGQSVAISGDGNTAIVGGPFDGFSGAAWIFTRSGGTWTQQGNKLVGTGALVNAFQGSSVALSSDGSTALIGGPADSGGIGAVWVFTRNGSGAWTQQAKLVGANTAGLSGQGISVALSSDGNTALVGGDQDGNSAGAAWVFTRNGSGAWSQQGPKLTGLGATGTIVYQGHSVALSSDGSTAALGGYFDGSGAGATWVFTRSNGIWIQQGLKLVGSGGFSPEQGRSVALSGDGNTLLIGGPLDISGWIWVFRRSSTGIWTQQGNRVGGTGEVGGGQFGWSVALSGDGSTALVGGPSDGLGSGTVLGAVWPFAQVHFGFSAPAAATGGVPFNFTVSALDANNAAVTTYGGTVHFTSSDSSAVLPADATLASGVGNLSATLKSNGSQTITATDTANSALKGTSGAITVTNGTATLAPAGVSPAGGSASSQTMTFTFSDPKGYTDLGVVNILINNFLDGRHACYLAYSQPMNVLYLVADDGGTLSAGAVLTASGSTSNSQCTVSWGSAPVTGSGNNLTLTLTMAFSAGFAGNKVVYMAARDQATGNSGWQALGVWQVPGGTPSTTTLVVGVIPNRGSGLGPTAYTFSFSDTKGYADLGVEDILINTSLDGRQACYLAYARPINTLYLMNDSGSTLLAGQSLAAAGNIGNSQCTVTWGASAVTGSGNNLALTLNITFSASFDGSRIFYLAARDVNEANSTDWQTMGTWTVQ